MGASLMRGAKGDDMRDFIYIGSAPCEEECIQVDPKVDYLPAMREECKRFIRAIRKVMGDEPDGAELRVKTELGHDFGTYLEVVCYYDTENEAAVSYAFRCESEAPAYWPEGI